MSAAKPLSAKSSVSEWLKHPLGGALLRRMLADGGMDESVLRTVRLLSLQRLVSLSKGRLAQETVDQMVITANGGVIHDDPVEPVADVPVTEHHREVVVVIGVGGMGQTIARRQGSGKRLVLADFSQGALDFASESLRDEGFDVTALTVDVSSRESVADLAVAAEKLGPIVQVVHTAGLSPNQAPTQAIIDVDLVGVALVLEIFGAAIAPGGAGVVISSMAGHSVDISDEIEDQLAVVPADSLKALDAVTALSDPSAAYAFAKRANQVRVQAESVAWGARSARINSVSPGVISTPMGRQELASDHGDVMEAMIAGSGTGRIGTSSDIAAAVAFLLDPTSSFITGTDLLVDGGVVGARRVQ
ncbi:SDR family oxidoreductase [Pseudolysinimonas sp.]|uniref:SDR family oxidoreductase n=1 Tax=Pseudolysinimonas sp. TaxID=2680009 RepID=UPI00286B170C|nr:SDR family oxidoreductase [Pseudolysinimonas sp.]